MSFNIPICQQHLRLSIQHPKKLPKQLFFVIDCRLLAQKSYCGMHWALPLLTITLTASFRSEMFSLICRPVLVVFANKFQLCQEQVNVLGTSFRAQPLLGFWETSLKCFWDVLETSLKSSHWDSVAPSGETCLLIIILLPPLVQHCLKKLPILGLT